MSQIRKLDTNLERGGISSHAGPGGSEAIWTTVRSEAAVLVLCGGEPSSRGREIPGRPSLPRPLPKPERQLNPRSRRMRDGRRDPVDPSRDRLSYQRRLERSLVDVGVYQSVSFRDLAEAHFDGHPYVARRAVNQWIRAGALREHTVRGPKGNACKVLTATPAGAELARRQAVGQGLDSGQRTWAGLVKPGELAHDTEVYRAARAEIKRLLADQEPPSAASGSMPN